MIAGDYDKIEISHESFSRKVFATGALRAAKFIHEKSGYYEMSDVLNLKKVLNDYLESENRLFGRKAADLKPDMADTEMTEGIRA